MKEINDKPLQKKCAWCKGRLVNHHRLCDKCFSVKERRVDIGRRKENIPNKSKSDEHNKREIERWNKK